MSSVAAPNLGLGRMIADEIFSKPRLASRNLYSGPNVLLYLNRRYSYGHHDLES